MKAQRRVKRKANWVLRVVLIACAIFLFLKIVQIQGQLNEKQRQISVLESDIHKQTLIVEDLDEQIEHADEYLERRANEEGLVLPGQQVYQSSAG